MVRNLIAFAGAAAVTGVASAAFVGVDIREDKDYGDLDLPAGTRTFNLYAQFDGNDTEDAVLSAGQPNAEAGFGIDLDNNPGAFFYQNEFGGATAPASQFIPAFPALQADTFVTIGVKINEGDSDNTSVDPDFDAGGFTDTDGDGNGDFIRGGWFNSSPPSRQGEGTLNPDNGLYETVIAQLSVIGLSGDVDPGFIDSTTAPNEGDTTTTYLSTLLTGRLTVFTQGIDDNGNPTGQFTNEIFFEKIPTPGAAALFGIAGVAATRRRR